MINALSKDFPAKPIWLAGGGEKDEYVDFYPDFTLKKGLQYTVQIAADTDYNVYVGESLVAFGQYAGYPDMVTYDTVDFTAENDGDALKITAWHCGVDSSTYINHPAYVAFCIRCEGELVYASSAKTKSAFHPTYLQHKCRMMTSQIGLGFSLDGTTAQKAAAESAEIDIGTVTVNERPNRRLELQAPVDGRLIRTGSFRYKGDACAAVRMKEALLDIPADAADGSYYLYDFGAETVGFPEVTFNVSSESEILVGWGEHIEDGLCRTSIGSREFAFSYRAHMGDNHVFPTFRRLGCRYIQAFVPGHHGDVCVRIHPVVYPVDERQNRFTGLRHEIYKTAVRTLRCCMHEHYEDCPWREQSFYALDSRNQMLAGYSVFADGNVEMVRASLDLISKGGMRADGILSICYPAGFDAPIPFYSLAYFLQTSEYVAFSGDDEFATQKLPFLEKLMGNILACRTSAGKYRDLVPEFPSDKFWNFYEWSDGMSGDAFWRREKIDTRYAAPFNAALVLALHALADICRHAGADEKAAAYGTTAEKIRAAMESVFLREDGYYSSFEGETYSASEQYDKRVAVLTQALCMLCGCRATERALAITARNGGDNCDECGVQIVPATLSMACFRYDALLAADREKYTPVILNEIDRDCGFMLDHGATTFWETMVGQADFGGAGSLCHGWSAMAAYYYDILTI